jgi:hypothetical protein
MLSLLIAFFFHNVSEVSGIQLYQDAELLFRSCPD